ncbi:MAG: hypothetical protein P1V21_01185 [Rhizobiaceae bacterium]|nr:hypothetical protein [Rhizobiaceae bacterium]
MPSFFSRYQVKHGHPIGEPSYWNRRLKDIDARIASNEDVRGDLEAVIEEGRAIFRDKANDVLLPLIQEVSEIANIGVMLRVRSDTEHNVEIGGKTFTVNEGERLRYAPPAYVAVYRMESPQVVMLGQVVSYDSGTGELVVDIDRVSGEGQHGGWTITPASPSDVADAIASVLSAVSVVVQAEIDIGALKGLAADAAAIAIQKASEANASSGSANDSADRAQLSIVELNAIYANQSQIYLGASNADPVADLLGNPLVVGAEYWNSVDGQKKIYDGVGWTVSHVPVGSEVTSIFGRTGNVVAQVGDYSAAKITMTPAFGLLSVDVQAGLEEIKNALDNHDHEMAEITDLQAALDGKSDGDHTHGFAELTAKPTTIAGYAISDAYTKTELDGFLGLKATIAYVDQVKSDLLGGAPAAALDTILELGAELTNNGSAIASIVSTLATKSTNGHGHAIADVAGLQTALDGKTNAGHGHTIADITSLQTSLDAKLAASVYTAADVMSKLKTVDGGGSGVDADLLDGVQGSGYVQTSSIATAAQFLAGAAGKLLPADGVWDAVEPVALADTATVIVDLNAGTNFTLTLVANRTISFTNTGLKKNFMIEFAQDGAGNRQPAVDGTATFGDAGVPDHQTGAGKKDYWFGTVSPSGIVLLSFWKGA